MAHPKIAAGNTEDLLRPIPTDELCACIDAHCPACGWPERITPLDPPRFLLVFGCRKCQHLSFERDR